MPLYTQEQKTLLLNNRGLNPDEWDITDDKEVVPRQTNLSPQPSVAGSQILTPANFQRPSTMPVGGSDDSPLTTGVKSFAQEAPSAIGGGLGGAGGLAIGSALAPETGGLSFLIPLLASLGGAYFGSKATSKVQQAIEPQSWQQNVAESAEENPTSATVGRLASIPLSGFKPSPGNLLNAARTVPKLLTSGGLPATADELGNLINVGTGAGVGAGMSVADQVGNNQPFSMPDVLKNAAIGALFNKPNAIGRRLGFHDTSNPDIHQQLEGTLQPNPAQVVRQQPVPEGMSPEQLLSVGGAPETRGDIISGSLQGAATRSDKMAKYKTNVEPTPDQLQTMEGEGGIPQNQEGDTTLDDLHNLLLSIKKLPISQQEGMRAFRDLLDKAHMPKGSTEPEQLPNMKGEFDKITEPIKQQIKEQWDTYYNSLERLLRQKMELSQQPVAPIEEPLGGKLTKNQEEASALPVKTKQQEEVLNKLGKPYSPTKNWFDILTRWMGDIKGIKMDPEGNPVDSKTGNPVTGQTLLENGIPKLITLSKDRRGADTPIHELYHAFVAALRQSNRPADQRMVSKYDSVVQASPDYQTWKTSRDKLGFNSSPEEYQATNAGYEFIKRHLNVDNESGGKKWMNDFKSYLKTRFSKHATPEDFQRLLDYRMTNEGKPLGEYFGQETPGNVAGVTTAKNQEDESNFKGTKTIKIQDLISPDDFSEMPNKFDKPVKYKNESQDDYTKRLQKHIDEQEAFKRQDIIDADSFKKAPQEIQDTLKDSVYKKPFYHLTTRDYVRPDFDKAREGGRSVFGMHFGSAKAANDIGQSKHDARISRYWLDVKNPYKVDDMEANTPNMLVHKMLGDRLMTENEYLNNYNALEADKNFATKGGKSEWSKKADYLKELLTRAGYDGLEYENKSEDVGSTSVVPFTKEQAINQIRHTPQVNEEFRDPVTKRLYQEEYSQLPVFKPELEHIKDLETPEGDAAYKGISKYFPMKDEVYGKSMSPILKASNKLSRGDLNKVQNVLLKENADNKDYSSLLSDKQLKLHQAIRQSLLEKQQDQIAANQPVKDYHTDGGFNYRLPKVDPFYFPNKIAPETIEALTNPEFRSQGNKLKQDFIQHQLTNGVSQEAADAKLASILTAYDKGNVDYSKFNANREAQGVGLPDSWMRRGRLLPDLHSYYTRVASDRAYHDAIESDPKVAGALGIKETPWGEKNPSYNPDKEISGMEQVRNIMERIHGEPFDKSDKSIKSLNRIATSLMLGPLTNIHIAGSSVANSLNYATPGQSIPAITHGITNLTTGIEHAYQTGYLKKNLSSVSDILDSNTTALEKMGAIATSIGNLSGRSAFDKITKGYLQSFGEYLIKQKALEANGGDTQAINLMKHADPDWTSGKTYSPDELIKTASNFASLIHGGHDARTLPGWMLKDTAIQPFLQLMSWNIGQTNQWMRHVWTPATKGNFTPLIMSTLGAGIGGYVIKQARETLSDKKSPIPSLNEIVNSSKGVEGNIPLVAYNLMAMSSYTGYAGILSVVAKAIADVAHKNIPQGAAFPLDEVISNPVHLLAQYAGAAMNDPDFNYFQGGAKLVTQLSKENIQLGRLITSWGANIEGIPGMEQEHYLKGLNQKTQDLRRFEMVEGMPYDAQTPSNANPFMDQAEKNFKRTDNIGEAAGQLPDLIQSAFEKFQKSGGNIDVLKKEMAKLKQNNYETMPSPDRVPQSFFKYLSYLTKTEGPEEASKRMVDYITKNIKNKAKAEMVPSF